ncbi:phosphatase PAP2 family protein [Siminovitchia acidinfaciens]|uniref:Phosphatase PAP2 family protein n=1 Tax=Siminovitchia acidinfaciens TaxID=2321395 RepID=A0A429Y8F9_9BACI|nr:VTT domain-containing protein [Siminovitchia acidinfaciens]RST77594.1 phosphatase PAP2 family protein [Siminovitchia acidinfaciens]
MQLLTGLIEHFGYTVLFMSLMLELIALPLPGEFLMGYAGVLVFQGKMNWTVSILIAGTGSCTGMTLSYLIGHKLGAPFFYKHGHRIHFGPERLEKTSSWFKRHGNKLLIIAYFIPGIRHVTGYFSGITRLRFSTYSIYAFTGAFIWTSTFISLGKLLGPQWEQFHTSIKKYLLLGSIFLLIIFTMGYLLKTYKLKIKVLLLLGLGKGAQRFQSLRRLRFLIGAITVIFLTFVIIMGSLIENYLNNEFKQFDDLVMTLIPLIFNEKWGVWMKYFGMFSSVKALISLVVFSVIWILIRGTEKRIESSFLLIIVIGGEIYEEGIRRLFHHLHPVHALLPKYVLYPFPSEQTLTAFVLYGFSAYLLIRHLKKGAFNILIIIMTGITIMMVGLSRIYFLQQSPSDVVAGYVFGGVWLSLNILILEVFRFSHKLGNMPDFEAGE